MQRLRTLVKQKPWLIFLIFGIAFFLLRIVAHAPRLSDENLYYYAGYLMQKGILPYRDFFIANPPLQIMLYSIIIKIFGFNLTIMKISQTIVTLGTAYLLFNLLEEKYSKKFGLIASVFFLSSYLILVVSEFAVGVHEATFFLVLSWYLYSRNTKLSGLALFLGLMVKRYILPAALGLVLYGVWRRNYKKVTVFLFYSLGAFLLANLILFAVFRDGYFDPVWKYQYLKPDLMGEYLVFAEFIRNDAFIILFSFGAAYILLREWLLKARLSSYKKKKDIPQYVDVGLQASFAIILQYSALHILTDTYLLYLVTLVPFFAVLASLAIAKLLPSRSFRVAVLLVVAVVLLNSFMYMKNQHTFAKLNAFESIVSDVRYLTNDNDKIFGEYNVTTLIALVADREIIENEADLNVYRYFTGLLSKERATMLATSSAVFFQTALIEESTGEILRLRPAFVNQSVIRGSCILYRQYRINELSANERIFLWNCKTES